MIKLKFVKIKKVISYILTNIDELNYMNIHIVQSRKNHFQVFHAKSGHFNHVRSFEANECFKLLNKLFISYNKKKISITI